MEPDSSYHPAPGREGDPFLRRLDGPLRYLRGLDPVAAEHAMEAVTAAEDDSAQPPGDSIRDAGGSIVRRLEKRLGFAPALDLAFPGGGTVPAIGAGEERYSVEGELGSGGMGRVLLVYDQDIRRRVAMKVLRDEVRDPKALTRFIEEAQATGQLEHPNIAPVYDLGIDRAGRVFFTMKLVRGRNLAEIIRDLAIGRLEVRRHFTLTRLVQTLQQASMGVHYAHVRGVIHRDLKPDNVMVGDFGEVLVMDWGLAKIAGRYREEYTADEHVASHRRESGLVTLDGTIQGTLAYIAPEQARGWQDEIDERTDVFGLGAILYQVLTYHPLYEGTNLREILGKAGVGDIVPPRERSPRNPIPPSLEAICMKALAVAKEERYPDAKAFHEALQVYLDGTAETERRRREAIHLVRQGKHKVSEYRRLAELESSLRQRSKEALIGVEPHDPAEKKAAGWELEDEAGRVRQERVRTFNEATSYLHSAIDVDEGCSAAKEALASLYWERFQEAERAGNADDMTMYRGLIERYDEGRLAAALEGKGSLHVQSDPSGAEVRVYRMEERARRLAETGGELAGRTPLSLELAMGHHLLVLTREGCPETRYPVVIERCGRLTAKVRLFRDDEVGEGMVHVPAGDVSLGGDPSAPGSLEPTRRYVADFFLARFPVTFREYCLFLDDLVREGHPDLRERLPRTEREGECVVRGPDGCYRPDVEKLVDPPARDRYPPGFESDLPVLAVSWNAARHYCEWLSRRTGRRIRLPRDVEWEKAARGAARSIHPWGDFFDWSFTKGGSSRAEPPQPEPVGAFATDVSIYGVRDLAGSIREWCDDWYIDKVGKLVRGGYWGTMNPAAFRAAVRSGSNPGMKSSAIGFRIAAEPPVRGGGV